MDGSQNPPIQGMIKFLTGPQSFIVSSTSGLNAQTAIFIVAFIAILFGVTNGMRAIVGDTLFGNDTTFHGTLFSTFSQIDAIHRVLLAWSALGVLIIVFTTLICIGLKRKDVRV